MNLTDTLTAIAAQLGIDPGALLTYQAEDDIGGYHPDPAQAKWPIGSIWAVEGKTLYALVRALKPARALELGTYHGCSATHLATALRANGSGSLTCVDNGADAHRLAHIGHLIPGGFDNLITLVDADMTAYAETTTESYDFIFEDGMHSTPQVQAVWTAAIRGMLNPCGVIVSHDAAHYIVGHEVQAGIAAGLEGSEQSFYRLPSINLAEPSDCGLAVWKKPAESGVVPIEDERTPAEPEKPKRMRKAKK